MIKVVHRVNEIDKLIKVPLQYGVEIDVRTYYNTMILNHEPRQMGDIFKDYIKVFKHKFLIIDVK